MSPNTRKPVIAIVQGAWHRKPHYESFAQALTSKGYTVLQPENITAGQVETMGGKTHLDDVEAKGFSGGIIHVVYVASFALPVKGLSLLAAVGGAFGPFLDRTNDALYLKEGEKDTFYNDLPSEEADKALAHCVHQSTASLETPADFVATDITVPKTYVVCDLDHCIPLEGQKAMAGAMGEGVQIETIHAGHVPFLSEEAMGKVVDIVEKVSQ